MRHLLKTSLSLCNVLLALGLLWTCKDDPHITPEEDGTFAKGADVSWITQMEHSGRKFYNAAGAEMDGIRLLGQLGMNAIRLRVWVDPDEGWCGTQDLLVKAYRAHNLGMRILVDFHYSDTWADPGNQNKPKAWEELDFEGLQAAVSQHTIAVLNTLKNNGITPDWVQVGNETGNGMLWEDGKASINMANYAELNNAGYDAVKSVFPETDVIVHLQEGENNDLFRWLFDGLKNNGGKWDVIGMSLYPLADWRNNNDTWQKVNADCLNNMNDMVSRYGSDVMICEVGFPWDQAETAYEALKDIIAKTKSLPQNKGLGVFYWEPQSYGNWNGYSMGAFDNSGRPTVALDAFK